MDSREMKRLTGMIVTEVVFNPAQSTERLDITFIGGVKAKFQTYGDCCSRTWIEHLTVPPDIVGATILGHSDSGMVNAMNDDDQVTLVYSEAIRTTKGDIVIEFRNASNGYYGGSLEGPYIELS